MFRVMALFFGCVTLVGCLLQPRPYTPPVNEADAIDIKATKELLGRDVTNILKLELIKDLEQTPGEQTAYIVDQLNDQNLEKLAANSPSIQKRLYSYVHTGGQSFRHKTENINLLQPKEQMSIAEEQNEKRTTLVQAAIQLESVDCPSFKAGIKSWAFVAVCILAYTSSMYNYFLNSSWKKLYPTLFDVDDSKMSILLSIGALSNSIFRLLVGFCLLKISFKTVFIFNVCVAILSSLTIVDLATSYEVAAIYLTFAFGGIGIHITLFPTICLKIFGPLVGPKIYPCAFFMFSLASMTQYAVLNLAHDNWRLMTYVFAGVTGLGLGTVLFMKPAFDWRPAIEEHRRQASETKPASMPDKDTPLKAAEIRD